MSLSLQLPLRYWLIQQGKLAQLRNWHAAAALPARRSLAHNGMPLYVLACHAVQYDSQGGAQLLKPALVECVQRFVCGEDEGKRRRFAAAHQAADAVAKAVAAAGVDSLTPAQKDAYKAALLANPMHK